MGARILVLEDDVPTACEIQAALVAIGYEVEILRDGNAGLARAASVRFDLVVAVLELPGMNGFRFCNRLKKASGRATPVFLLTEQLASDVFDEHRKLPTRAESYFHKPLTMVEIVARVRTCLAARDAGESDLLDDLVIVDGGGAPNGPASIPAGERRSHSIAPTPADRPGAGAREEVVHRERLVAKDAQIARLRGDLDAALRAGAELGEKILGLEADRLTREQKMHEQARQIASLEKVRAELEHEFGQAMDERRGELEVERSHVFAQMERAHAVALRRTMENGERERVLLSARVAELDKSLADAEDAVDSARRGDASGANEMALRIDGLEALAASRTEDLVMLARELDDARFEVPALEAEISAFRTELTSMRLQLDDQAISMRVANEELAEARRCLAMTESALGEALARLTAMQSTGV